MSSSETLYWHDYETWGADASFDRPVQFAGQRTDLDLKPIGEPLRIYARPPKDVLPQPAACLVTGITPQHAQDHGVCEADFIAAVEAELSQPGTCGVGYNSLRFDDTVTRFTLYRNLRNPYAREFGAGRSRWDLIDGIRTAYALRPEGISWPTRDDGLPSFRLEDLTAANGITHGDAHDALADVMATIEMARLLRRQQPKLYDWLYRHRAKRTVQGLLDLDRRQPLLHVSGMFGAARANLGMVLPLAWHPVNRNELFCADLSIDAQLLIDLPVRELARLLYAPTSEYVEGEQRPGLKSVHINRCPVLLPTKMLDEQVAERASLDRDLCRDNLRRLLEHEQQHPGVWKDRIHALVDLDQRPVESDPELMLYTGGFLPDADRKTLDGLIKLAPEELANQAPVFEDSRLEELFFRYRARNWPELLPVDDRMRWEEFRFQRLEEGTSRGLSLEQFHDEVATRIAAADLSAKDQQILDALQQWGDGLLA